MSIKDFFNKPKWIPTEEDLENKTLLEETLKTLPPLGPSFLPIILSFYVDDGFFHGKATPKGIRYNPEKNQLEMSTAQLEIDENLPPDIRMINLILAIGNTIDKDIEITGDCPSMNPTNFMPLLLKNLSKTLIIF